MKKMFFIAFIFSIFAIAVALWWRNGISPVNPKDKTSQIFVIPKGKGIKEISNDLKSKNLIKDTVVFFILLKQIGLDKKIQAGDFKLSRSMTSMEIAQALTRGSIDIWITIPEGWRAEEIADILEKTIPAFDQTWRKKLNENEGYLFPDTYLIPKNSDIESIVSILKNNFYQKAKETNLSKNSPQLKNIIIIASLIEREAITDEEKPLIASVIYNRLKDGISLDIDATLQYVKGKDANGKWWSFPTTEDKKINSPYNTYLSSGLPPGPISNPGIETIKAALNPKSSNYYYYLHDQQGKIYFSRTLEEHNANVAKYIR